MRASREALELLRRLDRRETFETLAPTLNVARRTDFGPALPPETRRPEHTPNLGAGGFLTLPRVVPQENLAPMRAAVRALAAEGLPTVLAHVYDEFWAPLAALHDVGIAELGEYDVLDDGWVFEVPSGQRGWRPHRGLAEHEGTRTMLNVWIALTRATRATSCMHVVPLDADPAYPDDLARTDAAPGAEIALEVDAGTACIWDANALHWGGEMTDASAPPRVSLTFTLRKSTARRADMRPLDVTRLDLRARLDFAAAQVVRYAHLQRVSDVVMEWATLTFASARAASLFAGP